MHHFNVLLLYKQWQQCMHMLSCSHTHTHHTVLHSDMLCYKVTSLELHILVHFHVAKPVGIAEDAIPEEFLIILLNHSLKLSGLSTCNSISEHFLAFLLLLPGCASPSTATPPGSSPSSSSSSLPLRKQWRADNKTHSPSGVLAIKPVLVEPLLDADTGRRHPPVPQSVSKAR